MSPDRLELTRQALQRGGTALIVFSQVGILFSYVISIVVSAAYFTLVGKLSGGTMSFRHWFSVVAWTSVVGVLSVLARGVAILAAPDGRLGYSQANPLSLASILGGEILTFTVPHYDITSAWRWVLLCLAYKRCTRASWISSIVVVLTPILFLYPIPAIVSSQAPSVY